MYNSNDRSLEGVAFNQNQILSSRQTDFIIRKDNKLKVGLIAIANEMSVLNGKIPLRHTFQLFPVYQGELTIFENNISCKFFVNLFA